MADLGAAYADKKIDELDAELKRLYAQAQKDIEKKTSDFFAKSAAKETEYLAKVKAGTMKFEDYHNWRSGQLFIGAQWKAKEQQITETLAQTNSAALQLINGQKSGVFAFNANYSAYQLEHDAGVNFGFQLYDQATVERLVKDQPKILPQKKLAMAKDTKWNERNIRSQLTQGIVQGESIPDIAKRMMNVTDKNANQSMLYARTAVTSAQNGGRQARYEEAEELGIKFKKVWMATLDDRTRDLHRDLDGQAVDPDEDFKIDGYTIAFPADPSGEPEMVYNCRCTMTTELVNYPKTFTERSMRGEDGRTHLIEDMTYREWEASKQAMPEPEQEQKAVDYFGKTAGWMNDTDKEAINKMFDDTDSVAKDIWMQCRDELEDRLDPDRGNRAYFGGGDKRVHFNVDNIRKGDSVHAPYQNYFHEYFHNIDYLLGGKDSWNYLSNTYVDPTTGKTFDKMIGDECKNALKNFYEQNKANFRFGSMKFSDVMKDSWYSTDLWFEFKRDVSMKYTVLEAADISDMFEKYSVRNHGGAYPFGCGHGSAYAVREGARAREAFAEMADATFANEGALRAIKEYFPKSYGMWEDMLKGALTK